MKKIRIFQNYFGLFLISLTEGDGEPVGKVIIYLLVEVSVILGDAHAVGAELLGTWILLVLTDGLNDLIAVVGFPCRVEPFPPVTEQSG